MTVFYYDKTFEGLLTALFDAYARRMFPEYLCGEGRPAPMFAAESHHVVSDASAAARVWKGFSARVPREVCNMTMCVWLSEEQGSDELLFRYMRRIFDSPRGAAFDFSDNDILQVKKLAQRVSQESQRLRMFVRFQKAADGTFFAPVAPQYNSLPLSLGYFRDRFADQKWLIYDTRRRYGYVYDLRDVTEITLTQDDDLIAGKLSDEMSADDEKQFSRMWRMYHKAMAIEQRINPRLQRQMMPRKYWKYLTEMQQE